MTTPQANHNVNLTNIPQEDQDLAALAQLLPSYRNLPALYAELNAIGHALVDEHGLPEYGADLLRIASELHCLQLLGQRQVVYVQARTGDEVALVVRGKEIGIFPAHPTYVSLTIHSLLLSLKFRRRPIDDAVNGVSRGFRRVFPNRQAAEVAWVKYLRQGEVWKWTDGQKEVLQEGTPLVDHTNNNQNLTAAAALGEDVPSADAPVENENMPVAAGQ